MSQQDTPMPPADAGPVDQRVRPLVEAARACARHCIEGAWAPNILQNEQGVRLNAARLLDDMAAKVERLTAALKAANDQAEHFERAWYLRGDVLEKLKNWADAYPVEMFPEVLRQEWQQANEVLAQAGLSMTRMSASNMRHIISGVRKLVDEGLKA